MKFLIVSIFCFLPLAASAEDFGLADIAPYGELASGLLGGAAFGTDLDFAKIAVHKNWEAALPEEYAKLAAANKALNEARAEENKMKSASDGGAEAKRLRENLRDLQARLKTAENGLTQKGLSPEDTKTLHDERKLTLAAIDDTNQEMQLAEKNMARPSVVPQLEAIVAQRKDELEAAKFKLLKAPSADMNLLKNREVLQKAARRIWINRIGMGIGALLALDGGRRVYTDLSSPAVIEQSGFMPKVPAAMPDQHFIDLLKRASETAQ